LLTVSQVRLWKDSETLYRHTLSVTGPNPITQGNLGTALLELRRFDEAIEHFAEATRLKPDYAEALSNWGFALALEGKLDEAVPKYRASLALKPNAVRVHYIFGQALLLQGKRDEAIAEFSSAVEVDPDFSPVLNDLAWIRATDPEPQNRNGAQAVSLAEHACALSGFQNPMFIGTLAASYAEVGRFDDAVRMCEKARELANTNGQKGLAERNEQLLQFYRAGKPFHEVPADKHEAENSKP
jgi:Flp pilus assembly protein TadD